MTETPKQARTLLSGQRDKEFTWFALGASLPLLSMDAERAARRVVAAMRTREGEVILTPAAQAAARAGNLFPALTVRLLHVMSALLPDPTGRPRHPWRP